MTLNALSDHPRARKARKRVGRGPGSGTGKLGGRGQKGQKSRSGVAIKGFEGGQMPLFRRLPKRGFRNPNPKRLTAVGIGRIQEAIDRGRLAPDAPVRAETLKAAKIIRRVRDGVRILANGTLTSALTCEVAGVSKGARAAIEAAGGKITVLGGEAKTPAARNDDARGTDN